MFARLLRSYVSQHALLERGSHRLIGHSGCDLAKGCGRTQDTVATSISTEVCEAALASSFMSSAQGEFVVLVWSLVVNSENVGYRLLSVYGACDLRRLSHISRNCDRNDFAPQAY